MRTLEKHGAVSEPTVREMAAGSLRLTGADISIAVSGIAGPDGGSAEKPVGTVWFCVGKRAQGGGGGKGIELLAEGVLFGGNLEAVRRASVEHALNMALRFGAVGGGG